MNTYQLSIKETDDLSWAIQAAQDLAGATEKDLNTLKSKKWYHRILDVVTFSQGSKIQTLKNIETLAKLQEIVARVLVMLSQQNAEISTALRDQSELLKNLQCQDMALLNAIKKIKYGGTEQLDFSVLSAEKKDLLANLLLMVDPDAVRNENSRRYITSILQIANITSVDNTYQADAVEMLNKKEQELLYQMIMIYRYLRDIDFDEESDIIDNIGISRKRVREIQAAIKTTAENVVPDFFVSYYERVADGLNIITDDHITFKTEPTSNNNGNDSAPDNTAASHKSDTAGARFESDASEYINIMHISDVRPNEKRIYENKILHVTGDIKCEGSLKFINCIIRYDVKKEVGSIIVNAGGSIQFERCSFMGRILDINTCFIRSDCYTSNCKFIDCHLFNCGDFINTDGDLQFEYCTIQCPGVRFIKLWGIEGAALTLKKCLITNLKTTDFVMNSTSSRSGPIIESDTIRIEDCVFEGDLRINSAKEAANLEEVMFRSDLLSGKSLVVKKCSFIGLRNILSGDYCQVLNTNFNHCEDLIYHRGYKAFLMQDCRFSNCTEVGSHLQGDVRISDCVFESCYNRLFITGFEAGVTIDSCTFRNWSADATPPSIKNEKVEIHSMLVFRKKNLSRCDVNRVVNCTFEKIAANYVFAIIGWINENAWDPVVTVERCAFTDCTTKRESGQFIKTRSQHFGLWGKAKDIEVVKIADNTTGWKI